MNHIKSSTTKTCRKCGEEKTLEHFYRSVRSRLGVICVCKPCHNLRTTSWAKNNRPLYNKTQRAWRKTKPSLVDSYQIKSRYGLTLEKFDAMLIDQHFQCKICKINISHFKRRVCIDHDHITKKIRSLLCSGCNSSLGKMKYSIESFNNAIKYIQEHSPCH